MARVKDILTNKGGEIWSIESGRSVYDAIYMLAEKGVGALAVIDDGRLVGMISERDYTRQIILKGRKSRETLIRDIMSGGVVTTSPCEDVNECMRLMTKNRIRHLPVVEDDRVVGMVSIGDLVRVIIAEQQSTIVDLEKYISG